MGVTEACTGDRFSFRFPGRVSFGDGTVSDLPALLSEMKAEHSLILSGRTISEGPLMERVREILDLSGIRYGVFNGVEPETLVEIVKAAAEAARGAGYDIMTGQVTI